MDKTYMFVSFKGKFHSEFNHQIHTKIKKKLIFEPPLMGCGIYFVQSKRGAFLFFHRSG